MRGCKHGFLSSDYMFILKKTGFLIRKNKDWFGFLRCYQRQPRSPRPLGQIGQMKVTS